MNSAVNLATQNVQRNINIADSSMAQSMRRLTTGFRINTAADDPAGMSIVEKMKTQLRSINQANRNAYDAISLIRTAEGGMGVIVEMIQRMRELVIAASNDTNLLHPERERIQLEIDELSYEIDEVVRRTEFNTMRLLDGSFAEPPASDQEQAEPIRQLNAVSPSAVAESSPSAAMPTSPTVIDTESIAVGSGNGWAFSGGVLTISGGGDFRVDGLFMKGQRLMNINRIVVADSAETNLVLNNVNITAAGGPALDVGDANVNLFLLGNNVFDASGARGRAGIRTTGANLTIQGTGRLEALGGFSGAGIGGGVAPDGMSGEAGGLVTINSGTIVARGAGGAGIGGGGGGGNGGSITINGGNVTAYNIRGGAGIGGGTSGNGGNITITGGNITAQGGTYQPGAALVGGAGIGGGAGRIGGQILITGGTVHATGGNLAAGIGGGGGGAGGAGGDITISGGRVTASGGRSDSQFPSAAIRQGAAIGGGAGAVGANLIIAGGLVEISSGEWIGGGTDNLASGTTDVRGGNLSVNPGDIYSGVTHFGQEAFRVQITLESQSGNPVAFGAHRPVSYMLNDLSVQAITDSAGDLFMYLPVDFTDREGFMNFLGNTFENILEMSPNHDNRLVLRLIGSTDYLSPIPAEGGVLHFQVGSNAGHSMFLHIEAMHTQALGLRDGEGKQMINVMQESGQAVSALIDRVNNALDTAVRERSGMGAAINRLEFTVESLYVAGDNLSATMSGIRDTDMAEEMTNLIRSRVSVDVGMRALTRLHNQESTARLLDILA